MKCSIARQKQIVESAKAEYKRLADLQKQGFEDDLENDILDIQEAMDNMRAIIYRKPENIVESEPESVDEMFINELNNNNPKDGKVKLTVLNGVKLASGKVFYKVKYPNNNREYTLPASRISADQVNPSEVYGDNISLEDDASKEIVMDILQNSKNLNKRQVLTQINIINSEQVKRKELLSNTNKLTQYAIDRGVSVKNMRNLIRDNYINANKYLKAYKELEKTIIDTPIKTITGWNNIVGSDQNTGIGETEQDVFLGQEEIDLGQVLKDEFINYYGLDTDAGQQIQTQEFADLQNQIVDTYQQTMADLGTGNLKLRMFENMEKQTAGQIDLRTNEMQIRWNKMSRLSRLSEVFLHEINHKMSSHVFNNDENIRLRRLMEDLRQNAIDSGVTYELFLEGIENPTEQEIEIAKMKFEYTFDKTANVEEFYAYATTNENVYNAIKDVQIKTPLIKELELEPGKKSAFKTVLNAVIQAVNKVWRAMSGRGVRGGQMIADMVHTIAKLDAEAQQAKWIEENTPDGITDYAKTKINQVDEIAKPVFDKVEEWQEKIKSAGPKNVAEQIKRIPILNDLIETGISQYLWRAVTQDTTTENVADMYMVFRHSKQVIEKHTADIRNGVKSVATEMYKDVDEPTKTAVKRLVLEADLAQYSADEIKLFLEDEKMLNAEMKRLEKLIKKELKEKGWKQAEIQMDGLADYITTGKTTIHNQQINATNIVSSIGDKKKVDRELAKKIDKLVSLKAMKKSDVAQLGMLKEMVQTDKGLENLEKTVNLYRGYIDSMVEDATIDGHNPVPKGFTREAENLIRYELIPEHEVETQEKVLMKKVSEKPHVIVEGVKYYLMTGRTKSVGFNEGALGLISHTTEGIPVSSLIRKNNEGKKFELNDYDLRRVTKNIIKEINDQKGNNFKIDEASAVIPVYNHKKELVDYRIQLNKLEQEIYLPDRESGLEDVMSNTFSRSVKTSLTATENKRVIDQIIENSAEGILERPEDYVLIEEYTEEDKANGVKREKRHDRWDYLPDHTKDYIYQRLGKRSETNGLYIHKDFVELMTGEKDVTIGNFAKWGFDIKKYPQARARLMAMEAYIAEILAYVKNAMVVLNADVLLGNTVSNAMVAITHGVNPIKYSKKFKQRWQQLNDYNEKMQQLAELEVKQMAGEKVEGKIKQLKRQLEGNVWDELVKDGQYTALVEDINIEQKMDGQLAQEVQKYIDKSNMKGVIEGVRNALYIDKTSSLYNTMLKTVHYGDAITRQIIKEELEEKAIKRDGKITDKVEREILNYLDQLLVNYGYTMNRWWKYAERVGGLFFMRYYMGQAKAIVSMAKRSPTRTALLQGTQKLTGVDIADPIDTYTNSGIDGIAHRMVFGEAPELILEPNVFDLVPDMSSFLTIR